MTEIKSKYKNNNSTEDVPAASPKAGDEAGRQYAITDSDLLSMSIPGRFKYLMAIMDLSIAYKRIGDLEAKIESGEKKTALLEVDLEYKTTLLLGRDTTLRQMRDTLLEIALLVDGTPDSAAIVGIIKKALLKNNSTCCVTHNKYSESEVAGLKADIEELRIMLLESDQVVEAVKQYLLSLLPDDFVNATMSYVEIIKWASVEIAKRQ